jgi:hypothetical protein
MARIGRNDPCPCGSGRKYKKCCEDADRQPPPLSKSAVVPPGFTQLIIETSNGVAVRNVPPPMPLRLLEGQGKEAEKATHSAAATWGLADFVFRPEVRRLASGVRELGDGVLIIGDLGVVVQVKSREALSGDPGRERRWTTKQCGKALRQGAGTIRQLCQSPATMTNMRGRQIEVDGNDYRWVVAVVVDHPDAPEVTPTPAENSVFLLRRDWEFLFDQLKSTHRVGTYLERVAGKPQALGSEPVRYYELAAADEAATPTALAAPFKLHGIEEVSEPLLPMAPAATENGDDHALFRTILEDIAETQLATIDEAERIRALADLDHMPPMQRAAIGAYLRLGFERIRPIDPPEVLWHLRRVSGGFGATQLGFGVCSNFNEDIQWAFGTWVRLRHHEFAERLEAEHPVTVGVLLTPRADRTRLWDTSMCAIRGPSDLTGEELDAFRELWHSEQDALVQGA